MSLEGYNIDIGIAVPFCSIPSSAKTEQNPNLCLTDIMWYVEDGLQVVVGGKHGIEVWILQFWLDMIHDSLREPINCSSKNGLVILLKVDVVVQY